MEMNFFDLAQKIQPDPTRDLLIRHAHEERVRDEEITREENHRRFLSSVGKARSEMASRIGLSRRAMLCFTVTATMADSPALRGLSKWSGDGTLVLSGGKGVGKTVAANKWVWDCIRATENWKWQDGTRVKFNFADPIIVTAAHLARWPRYDEEAMNRIMYASRLVIDDIGCEFWDEKGSFLALLDELIDTRYAQILPTVITTNLDQQQFEQRVKERITRRIREDGLFFNCGNQGFKK